MIAFSVLATLPCLAGASPTLPSANYLLALAPDEAFALAVAHQLSRYKTADSHLLRKHPGTGKQELE